MSASAQQQPPSWVARMHVDVTPLRASRDFRLLFFSGVITYLGSMITYVALPFQVAAITGSFVAVGLIGLAELVPLVVFGLWGGALADSLDRRIMVVATEVAAGVLVMMLLLNSLLSSPQLWVLYVVAMLLAAVDGLQRPSLDAMTPRVVAHDQLAAAAALNAIKWQFGSIIGPAVGGCCSVRGEPWPRTDSTSSPSYSPSSFCGVCAASRQQVLGPNVHRFDMSSTECTTP